MNSVIPVHKNMAKCPFHTDSRASLILSDKFSTYKCLACNAKGDTIQFWASYNNMTASRAANDLISEFNLPIEYNYVEDPNEHLVLDRQKRLTQEHVDYLLGRGVERRSIDEFRIGAMGDNVSFPIFDLNERFSFFVDRSISGDYKGKSSETNGVIGNLYKVRSRGGKVYLCEGYIDCIQAWQENINAVCAFGSSFSLAQLRTISKYFKDIVLAYDNDAIGIESSFTTFKALKQLDPYIKVNFALIGTKDIGEHLFDHDTIPYVDLIEWCAHLDKNPIDTLKLVRDYCTNLELRLYLLKMSAMYGLSVEELEYDVKK